LKNHDADVVQHDAVGANDARYFVVAKADQMPEF
jgi:hypothetical protein